MKIVLYSEAFHSFMLNDIKYASCFFEKTVVICPWNQELEEACNGLKNVIFCPIKFKRTSLNRLKALKKIDRYSIKALGSALHDKKFDLKYLNLISVYFISACILENELKKLVQDEGEDWLFLSLWLHSSAYAVCRAKQKYPLAKTASLAHSFEVDDRKNPYVDYLLKEYCHENLDRISFISQNVLREYLARHVVPGGWKKGHIDVSYLGTVKKCEGMSEGNPEPPYTLISCSHCIPVKRIDLIIEALAQIKDICIQWIHIGGGELFGSLRAKAESLPENIEVVWAGRQDNAYVHKLYAETKVDAFINTAAAEGIPVALMEAIAYGIPIIATDVGGNSEIAREHVGKLISADPTVQEISDAIRQMLTADNETKSRIRKNCTVFFDKLFNSEHIRSEFYKSLSMLATNKRQRNNVP